MQAIVRFKHSCQQDSIPVGCTPPARWPSLDVSTGGGGSPVNKFEQVSSDEHHMSVAGVGSSVLVLRSDVWRGGGAQIRCPG